MKERTALSQQVLSAVLMIPAVEYLRLLGPPANNDPFAVPGASSSGSIRYFWELLGNAAASMITRPQRFPLLRHSSKGT